MCVRERLHPFSMNAMRCSRLVYTQWQRVQGTYNKHVVLSTKQPSHTFISQTHIHTIYMLLFSLSLLSLSRSFVFSLCMFLSMMNNWHFTLWPNIFRYNLLCVCHHIRTSRISGYFHMNVKVVNSQDFFCIVMRLCRLENLKLLLFYRWFSLGL